jgi:hypothetical protein
VWGGKGRAEGHLGGGIAGVDAAEQLEPRGPGREQQREILDVGRVAAPALELLTCRGFRV